MLAQLLAAADSDGLPAHLYSHFPDARVTELIGADGVHVGQADMPAAEARAMLGARFIIGGTANTFADVQRLAGHADPRTTRLYDRRRRKVTRNIVERISI